MNYCRHTRGSIHDKDYENPERNELLGTVNMEKTNESDNSAIAHFVADSVPTLQVTLHKWLTERMAGD